MGLFKPELMVSKKPFFQSIKKSSYKARTDIRADIRADKKRKKIYGIDG